MAIDNFVPEVWSATLLDNLDKSLVYGNIVNRDWEGDIKNYGDTVHINQVGPVTIFDYTKNTDMTDAETLSDATTSLVINKADAFNFQIDDVDKAQQNPKVMSAAMERAGYSLADSADQYIASLYTGVDSANIVGLGDDTTPVVPSKSDIYTYFTQASKLLDEANVPSGGRWAVIPPWLLKLLRDSGEFTADTSMGDIVKSTGMIGKVAGFDIYMSNNVPNTSGTKYKVMFGYNGAITFANQVSSIEAYRPEKRFADAVKGLHLYGAKLVQAEGIAVATFNIS